MWLELFRSIQPNFTADAQELGINFPTCHPWIVSAAGEMLGPVSPGPSSRAARCSPAVLSV